MSELEPTLLNHLPPRRTFLHDVLDGLCHRQKRLPCKYFYDQRGSQLFEQICRLDEYYLTRTELAIMRRHVPEMAEQIGPGAMLIEFGSGSSIKTRILLDHLIEPTAYVPVDISLSHLQASAARLSRAYPLIEVLPVCADFTETIQLPTPRVQPTHAAVFFPGSTIGNFSLQGAQQLLRRFAELCGRGGGLLIGIDLQKDPATIEAAYNDRQGVTAAFNLNLLRRINRELSADFDLEQFSHRARYNPDQDRMEIFLVSRRVQRVTIDRQTFTFDAGEPILTEYSHKYTINGFAELAGTAGFVLRRAWTDPLQLFAVLHLVLDPESP